MRANLFGGLLTGLKWLLIWLLLLGTMGWSVLALYYFDHLAPTLRSGLALAFGLFALVVLFVSLFRRWRRRALAAYLTAFVLLLICWFSIKPSNEREWAPETAVLPYATINGDLITVHNIRNFDYRTETDFTPLYYDKTFDLRQLDSVDMVTSYWMGPDIAHVFLSFGFAGKDYLAFSIEARKERTEGYSTLAGFFRQFELYYVVADERDVIRVRTNYRRDPPEDVYIYRVQGSGSDAGRRIFMEYIHNINKLKEHPAFYNTLLTNCTNTIWQNSRVNPQHLPFSWKILISGHLPEYLYASGRLDTSVPFAELRQRGHVNARAQAAGAAEDFSVRIRAAD